MPAPHAALTGTVINAQAMMLPNTFQLTARRDRSHPTATTEPTMQWVVLTGRPTLEQIKTVHAVPSPIQKPLEKKITADVESDQSINQSIDWIVHVEQKNDGARTF